MKKKIILLFTAFLSIFLLAACGDNDNSMSKGESLKTKDIIGTYVGAGNATKNEVARTQADINNQRYLFITGDGRESEGDFSDIVIEFEDTGEKDILSYKNSITGSNGELIYNSATGHWEGGADYPLGTVNTVVAFDREGGELRATFVFTQTFERETFENPEPSDGVNEFTLHLIKIK